MPNSIKPEVLSPAGSFEMLEAAVRSGADAVYFGAKQFSARRNAENFDIEEIKNAAEYCRIRGVKTYLTLNIMLKESELEDAFKLACEAYNAGVDGIIIQDLGLAKLLYENAPQIPLHASTQMSVHSPSALKFLKHFGFKRVVAAREMSFEALKELCEEAARLDMTVEVFVHGALCMCVSGQCLLSSFLGSRSGNRGLCAGPCRLPFLVDGGTGYDLSLKDLSLLHYVSELSEIGVASLKIEGRMKRPEYVAAATAACRSAADSGVIDAQLEEHLKNVFSRSGFTAGYFENKPSKAMFGVRTSEDINSVKNALPYIHGLYRNEFQRVPLKIKAEIKRDKPILLTFDDGVNTVTVTGNIPSAAKSKPTDRATANANLSKLGSTPYIIKNIETEIDDGLFVSASELNALRRTACEKLTAKRAELNRDLVKCELNLPSQKHTHTGVLKTYARFSSVSQIPEDLEKIDGIIIPLDCTEIDSLPENVYKIAEIPRGITDEKAIIKRLEEFKKCGFTSAMCGNIAAVELAKEVGFKPIADSGLNIYNTESLKAVGGFGINSAVLSNEILLSDAKRLGSDVKKGIVSYGKIPLMIFKNCPVKNGKSCKECDKNNVITDRKGISFQIRCRMGFSELFNSVPIWLADRKNELSGLDFNVLYFTDETKERAAEVISAYENGLAPDVKYTRGLFWRGTI